jgi:PadR family transcriptional regulator, regulatory protein AphA
VIQLTQTSYVVLGLISHTGEATPYDLKQIVAATIGGFFDIPHSQIYAEPERLAEAGYLSERREDGGRRRKHYALTQRGSKALEEWLRTPTEDLYELRDPGLLKLAFGSDPAELARTQLKAHEEQLKNLQQTARMLEMAGATEGQRLVAEAGVGHEKEYIRFWKRILKTRP